MRAVTSNEVGSKEQTHVRAAKLTRASKGCHLSRHKCNNPEEGFLSEPRSSL